MAVKEIKNLKHGSAFLSGLRKLKDTDVLSDVTVRVQGREFKTHRCVLAIFSDYWEAMFSSPMKEQNQATITLEDSDNITAEAFEHILHYYYTGELSLTIDNVSDIFKASAVTCTFSLAEECVQFITDIFLRDQHKQPHEEREIEREEYLKYFVMIEAYSIPELREIVAKAIAQNFSLVCDTEEFIRNISYEQLTAILDRKELASISELQVLQSVVSWLGAYVVRRKHIPQLITKVRLGLIPVPDLDRVLNESGLIQDPEVLRIHLELLRHNSIGQEDFYLENLNLFTSRQNKKTLVAVSREKRLKYYDANKCEWIRLSGSLNESDHYNSDSEDESLTQHNPSAVVVNNHIFVGGGKDSDDNCVVDFMCYGIGRHSWETLPNMLEERGQFPMVYLDGYIYAIGGVLGVVSHERCPIRFKPIGEQTLPSLDCMKEYDGLSSVERFSLKTRTWQKIAPLNHARYDACAVVKDGCIYVIGGESRHISGIIYVEQFIPKLNKWKIVGVSREHSGAAALMLNGQICVGSGNSHPPCEVLSISSEDNATEPKLTQELPTQELIPEFDKNEKVFRIGGKVFFNLKGFCYESDLVIGPGQVYDLQLGKWKNVFSECQDCHRICRYKHVLRDLL